MKAPEFEARLRARARDAGIDIDPRLIAPLHVFHELLARWNARINLTALDVDALPDAAVDRLFIEPLAAAPLLLDLPGSAWFDIGSGSGSPAIPLLLARPGLQLTMVESKAKKAAFLRETGRALELVVEVENRRLEQVVLAHRDTAGLVSMRGVRLDKALANAVHQFARKNAILAVFAADSQSSPDVGLGKVTVHKLTARAYLHTYRVSRGTND